MNNKISSERVKSGKEDARTHNLIEKLRIKLKNFTVIDRHDQLIGEVKNLILDNNRQIKLVISQINTEQSSRRFFFLISKLIKKIDPLNKTVFVDIDKAEIENLPEYLNIEATDMESSKTPNNQITNFQQAVDESTIDVTIAADVTQTHYPESADMQNEAQDKSLLASSDTQDVEEEIIRLLGERLIVERSKRKVGEVIVRKEIEIQMVQVPVRREKLIVEQVSPEHKQLAVINLGQEEVSGITLAEATQNETTNLGNGLTVTGEFKSPKIASLLLNAIAMERHQGVKTVRVEIVVEDGERQKTYQEWVTRASGQQS